MIAFRLGVLLRPWDCVLAAPVLADGQSKAAYPSPAPWVSIDSKDSDMT